ncbi:MAG: helix-turn-helix domain-containing protein [Patescibacteria group bacterium]|nr:helix-turn-helix domain-containing protein [Patescibacteria group bacterium]
MTLLTPEDLAELFKVPRRTAMNIAKKKGFPGSVTGDRKPRWLKESVEEWIASRSAFLNLPRQS